MSVYGVWREPREESAGLYPGLVVHDGRVTGSITVGRSRLPLWCFMPTAVRDGWDEAERDFEPSQYGWDAEKAGLFVYDLLEARGEFARLLLVIANAERAERLDESRELPGWWQRPWHRGRVLAQLRRCIAALEREL